ncbi:hypothetical protein B0T20DRAFT_169606 [Sordaria brevicollis]|uniref:Uncharacterized protein n=1 Tax=Sordaria brevicollis TaxID=83679 RepID=A0AAE0PH17_SORBR|nr:hypothetical protein B0T20DRAFT_169606 [Sordaria brevicollis]
MLKSIFLLTSAAASALAQTQPAPGGCTTKSFTIPSWFIHNFTANRAQPYAHYIIENRATNQTWDISCTHKDGVCLASGPGYAMSWAGTIKLTSTTAELDVKESWFCDDREPTKPKSEPESIRPAYSGITFQAFGNGSIPLVCDGDVCKSSNPVDLIRGSLTDPVAITPAYAEGPPGHKNPGCGALSKTPKWTLGTIIFINETGDGSSAIQSQSIQFQVTNEATGHVVGCLNYFLAGPGEDPRLQINCGGGIDRKSRYNIQTAAVFYPTSWKFEINETWYCDDVDSAKPVSITGTGSTKLPLTCTSESTTTYCQADSVPVQGQVVSETALAPYSIEDPVPTVDGCTISSVVSPSWVLSNFELDKSTSTEDEASSASISFNLRLNTQNSFFDFPVFVYSDDVKLSDANTWYPASFGAGEQPLAPRTCSFRYDYKTQEIAIKTDWVCIDIDPQHPVQFTGVATTKLPQLECAEDTDYGLTRCLSAPGYTWTSSVSNVTWRSLEAGSV